MSKETISFQPYELPTNQPLNGSPEGHPGLFDLYLPGDGATLPALDASELIVSTELTDDPVAGIGREGLSRTANSGSCGVTDGGCKYN